MRKSKGYAKGGSKMMKAMGGKMMKSKGYAKGGAKMMKAMGGKMAKGYAKGGAKMMRAQEGGIRIGAAGKGIGAKIKQGKSGAKTKKVNLGDVMKNFNKFLGPLPIPVSRKALIRKGIKKLVVPAMKNLGTIKPSKTKVIKSVRGMRKK